MYERVDNEKAALKVLTRIDWDAIMGTAQCGVLTQDALDKSKEARQDVLAKPDCVDDRDARTMQAVSRLGNAILIRSLKDSARSIGARQ